MLEYESNLQTYDFLEKNDIRSKSQISEKDSKIGVFSKLRFFFVLGQVLVYIY